VKSILYSLLLLVISQVFAADYLGPNRDEHGNIVPTPKGQACIAPIDEMRTSHMSMLLHKRDQTVHQGIRTKKASFTECINCHVTPDANGHVARIESEQHFCSSCHVAASVKLDCFECHADRPTAMFSQQIQQ